MHKLLGIILFALALWVGEVPHQAWVAQAQALELAQGDAALAAAFRNRTSNVQVQGRGVVARVLPDDNSGRRHQRFILQLASGQTILFAHNIEVAPRIEGLGAGDVVEFYGVYEWNAKGGTVHWTHRDPAGRHQAGWLRHKGRTFQ